MAVLGILMVLPYCHYVVYRGMQCRRYAGKPTFNQLNKVSPPLGHWNLETLEPRVHREGKGHRPENRERAPTRGTVFFVQVSPWQSLAVSPLRVSLPSRSWSLPRPGWCTLVAGTVFGHSFPETLKGEARAHHCGSRTFQTLCTGGALRRRHSQCARVAGGP